MLQLGTLDLASGKAATPTPSSEIITLALGNLVSDRQCERGANIAIEQLCGALVGDEPRVAQAYVDRLLDCGVSIEAIYETYLPRTAARLGAMWDEDSISFTAVTLAMARVTDIFRRLSPAFLRSRPKRPNGKRALFTLAPGETHALGVVMAADYFQRAGWSVRVELQADAAGLARIARSQDFDLIGISAGSRRMMPAVAMIVTRLRKVARSDAHFVLGGGLVALEPAAATKVGADLAICAAPQALADIERGS